MPPAKKSAKKAAKKTAGHSHDKPPKASDLRRAYEHMGRLAVLRNALEPSPADSIAELTRLAQTELEYGHTQDAADLLRASGLRHSYWPRSRRRSYLCRTSSIHRKALRSADATSG